MKEGTEMTLETLAQMVARGFQSVDERFDTLHQEVAEIREDVGMLKEDVGMLKEDVADLKVTVKRIDMRTQNQVDAVYSDITNLKKRVLILEKG